MPARFAQTGAHRPARTAGIDRLLIADDSRPTRHAAASASPPPIRAG